jgi:hypothetical protein
VARQEGRLGLVETGVREVAGGPGGQRATGSARSRIDGHGHHRRNVLPAFPPMEIGEAVGSHDPDEISIGKGGNEEPDRLKAVPKSLFSLKAGDANAGMGDLEARRGDPFPA